VSQAHDVRRGGGKCSLITDTSIIALARGCPEFTKLYVSGCSLLTDISMVEVARGCPVLTKLNMWGCSKLTKVSIIALARGCPALTTLYGSFKNIKNTVMAEFNGRPGLNIMSW
jgi:hypothetical protein